MSAADDEKRDARALRRLAEAKLDVAPGAKSGPHSTGGTQHELQVYQVELAMQNEALRQTQALLIEARDQYIDLYEFAPVGYLLLSADGTITSINLTGATLLGSDRKKLLHKTFRSFVVAEDQDRWTRHVLGFARGSDHSVAEFVLKRDNGTVFHARLDCLPWKSAAGVPSLRVTLADISVQKRHSEALAVSEALVAGTIESALDAIITLDDKQQIVVFNPAAEAIFGYTRLEMLGASLDILLPESARGKHFKKVRAFGRGAMSSRRMSGGRVVTARRRDGSEFPIEASISHVVTSHGQQYTIVLRDISERVKIEAALARAQEELHDIAKLASIAREQERRRIARDLHDDLAQTLWALKIELEFAKNKVDETPEQRITRFARLEKVIDGAIEAARHIATDLRPHVLDNFGLAMALESLVEEHSRLTGVTPQLSVGPLTFAKDDPCATAVFRLVQESLTNIAKHAEASAVEVSVHEDAEGLAVTIHDNGNGFRTTDRRKSTSFGLAGMRERVHLMRGTMSVDSTLGKGTSIHIRVPPPRD